MYSLKCFPFNRHEMRAWKQKMWCVLRVRGMQGGGCAGRSHSYLHLLCPSLTLHTPYTSLSPLATHLSNLHTCSEGRGGTGVNVNNCTSLSSVYRRVLGVRGGCVGLKGVRGMYTTPPRHLFWERDPQGGYGKEVRGCDCRFVLLIVIFLWFSGGFFLLVLLFVCSFIPFLITTHNIFPYYLSISRTIFFFITRSRRAVRSW